MTSTSTRELIGETLLRHVEAFAKGDLDALMSDYCEDAVLLTPEGVLWGSERIRAFFEAFLSDFPPGSGLEASRQNAERTVAYVLWSERSGRLDVPFATETLMIREGRILAQTFTARIDPR